MASLRNVLTAVVLVALLASYPTAAPEYSDWFAPVNLGAVVNSPFNDQGPAISKDGLSLYFSSSRPGGFGVSDIWVSQRASLEARHGTHRSILVGSSTPQLMRVSPRSRATNIGSSSIATRAAA